MHTIEILIDSKNVNLYHILTTANDNNIICLGTFIKGDNIKTNNVLTLYSSSQFKINAFLFEKIAKAIGYNFDGLDFAIMTSDIFKLWEDKDRYVTENVIN